MYGTVSVARSDHETTISIKGRFDFTMHSHFREAILGNVLNKRRDQRLIVDLAGAEYIDSAALGMLLLLREETDTEAINIEIVNARPEVQKILETASFGRLFKIM